MGSSPLTRGKLWEILAFTFYPGLIPAHAGKTPRHASASSSESAHPRSRGENTSPASTPPPMVGSSPLTRGKLVIVGASHFVNRLIPAHAGKTELFSGWLEGGWAHPRSRGENSGARSGLIKANGSSPLTRGKHFSILSVLGGSRLIPAHAGKTLPDLRFYCADRSDLGNP